MNVARAELDDAKRRGDEAVTAHGGGTDGVLAWAAGAGIDVVDWIRLVKELTAETVRMAPPAAAAHIVHGLHHTDVGEGLGLTLEAHAAYAFQIGWIAATLHAEIQAVKP